MTVIYAISFIILRIVDEVLEKRAKIFANIKEVMEALVEKHEEETESVAAKARELFNEFNDLLSKARNQLMSKEIILHDQMEVRVYDINLYEINKNRFKRTTFLSKKGYKQGIQN